MAGAAVSRADTSRDLVAGHGGSGQGEQRDAARDRGRACKALRRDALPEEDRGERGCDQQPGAEVKRGDLPAEQAEQQHERGGQAVAEGVAAALGCPCVGREILVEAAVELGVSPELLGTRIERVPRVWDRLATERRAYVVALQAALAERVIEPRRAREDQAAMRLNRLALTAGTNWILRVGPFMMVLSLATITVVTFAVAALALGYGALFPRFDTDNAADIPTGFGGLLFMMTGTAYLGGVIALEAWPVYAVLRARLEGVPLGAARIGGLVSGLAPALLLSAAAIARPLRIAVCRTAEPPP